MGNIKKSIYKNKFTEVLCIITRAKKTHLKLKDQQLWNAYVN